MSQQRRAHASVPGDEGAGRRARDAERSPSAPARRSGATSASPRRCSRPRSPRGSPPAAGCGSAPPGSPPTRRLRSSTSPSSARVKKQVIEHLGQLDFLHAKQNVILLGPPGTGKTHISIALGIRACLAGQRVLFRPRPNGSRCWPTRNARASSTTSSAAWSGSRCWSATRSATSRSTPKPRA